MFRADANHQQTRRAAPAPPDRTPARNGQAADRHEVGSAPLSPLASSNRATCTNSRAAKTTVIAKRKSWTSSTPARAASNRSISVCYWNSIAIIDPPNSLHFAMSDWEEPMADPAVDAMDFDLVNSAAADVQ